MSNTSRFTASSQSTETRLSNNTVGLSTLDDFRKRSAQVLEDQEREARQAALAHFSPPNRSASSTPTAPTTNPSASANPDAPSSAKPTSNSSAAPMKKRKKRTKAGIKLSFGDDGDDDDEDVQMQDATATITKKQKKHKKTLAANSAISAPPKSVTKSSLRRQAAERETLRKEFLSIQKRVKDTEVAIPFVFHDGGDIPGGVARVKKGDFVWVFLDRSRKVGAELGVGGEKNPNRQWARVGVDDLMLVRGTLIIPPHYDFYFFIMNKSVGPAGRILFDYSAEAEARSASSDEGDESESGGAKPAVSGSEAKAARAKARAEAHGDGEDEDSAADYDPMTRKPQTPIRELEGAADDPSFTKVVDRRWYERNKHIFPASTWQEFDPEKNYDGEIKRDTRGNAFFYSA